MKKDIQIDNLTKQKIKCVTVLLCIPHSIGVHVDLKPEIQNDLP